MINTRPIAMGSDLLNAESVIFIIQHFAEFLLGSRVAFNVHALITDKQVCERHTSGALSDSVPG